MTDSSTIASFHEGNKKYDIIGLTKTLYIYIKYYICTSHKINVTAVQNQSKWSKLLKENYIFESDIKSIKHACHLWRTE